MTPKPSSNGPNRNWRSRMKGFFGKKPSAGNNPKPRPVNVPPVSKRKPVRTFRWERVNVPAGFAKKDDVSYLRALWRHGADHSPTFAARCASAGAATPTMTRRVFFQWVRSITSDPRFTQIREYLNNKRFSQRMDLSDAAHKRAKQIIGQRIKAINVEKGKLKDKSDPKNRQKLTKLMQTEDRLVRDIEGQINSLADRLETNAEGLVLANFFATRPDKYWNIVLAPPKSAQ